MLLRESGDVVGVDLDDLGIEHPHHLRPWAPADMVGDRRINLPGLVQGEVAGVLGDGAGVGGVDLVATQSGPEAGEAVA